MGETNDGYGGNFGFGDSQNYGFFDEEFGSNKIIFSPDSNHQEGDAESSSHATPLGLTLRKTESFLNLLEMSLSEVDYAGDESMPKNDDLGSQDQKLKASNFPASFIKIGSWHRFTKHEGDLTAKLYYAKQKLVWEVLDGALKSKMEVQWSDIIAIRAITPEHDHGALEIELSNPPSFFREANPQPRKHTIWQQASDFTGGQAPIWRRHYVAFPPGVLDKHYQKLLQCDKRLLALSQKPFPSLESPYFDPTMFGIEELSNRLNRGYLLSMQYPHHTYPLRRSPNPSMPAMNNMPFGNEGGISDQILAQPSMHWNNQGPSSSNQVIQAQNYYQPNMGLANNVQHHLLGQSHSDMNPGYNVNQSGRMSDYQFGNNGGGDDQVMQTGVYSQNVNNLWAPPQGSNDAVATEPAVNSSVPPFFFGDPTGGDHIFNF